MKEHIKLMMAYRNKRTAEIKYIYNEIFWPEDSLHNKNSRSILYWITEMQPIQSQGEFCCIKLSKAQHVELSLSQPQLPYINDKVYDKIYPWHKLEVIGPKKAKELILSVNKD